MQWCISTCSRWPYRTLAFAWLILLTLLGAASSFKGGAPLDARTGLNIKDIDATLEFPIFGSAIEPLSAVAHAIVGAPDYRIAGISAVVWLFVTTGAVFFWISGRKEIKQAPRFRALKSLAAAVASALFLMLYLFFAIMVPLPSWSLVVRDPTVVVADLHSHTLWSHDGIVSPRQSFEYHRDRGYNVVAFTEHFWKHWRSTGYFATAREQHAPELIIGVEFSLRILDGRKGHRVLMLGARPDVLLSYPNSPRTDDREIRQFIDLVHSERGVILALAYRLNPKNVNRLAEVGVDGFEIANFGHPEMSEEMKTALLKVQDSHRVALLANSDWHGWSGFVRTWTLVKNIDPTGSRADQVIDALRNRDPERIVPVVSQAMGTPSILRGVFAPFVEIVRYGGELSPLRVVSWWIWTLLFVWAGSRLQRANLSPSRCLKAGVLLVLGGALLFRGMELMIAWSSGAPFIFPLKIGAVSSGIGIVALLIAGLIVRDTLRVRAAIKNH